MTVDEANHHHNQYENTQRPVNGHQTMIVGERCHHRKTNAEHRQHQRGGEPVKQPHDSCELPLLGGRAHAQLRTSEGVTALGSFFSPARRVNDWE